MPASAQDLATLLGVGAVEADDDRRPQVDAAERLDDALGDLLAAGDAAEDVDEDRSSRFWSKLITSSAAAITSALAPPPMSRKLAARAADLVDDVERAHRQPGAVGDDADRAVEADVLQVVLAGHLLALVELLGGPVLVPLGMAERGVVVEADLGVEGVHAAVGPQDQRVDLGQVAVALGEAVGTASPSMSAAPSTAAASSLASTARLARRLPARARRPGRCAA